MVLLALLLALAAQSATAADARCILDREGGTSVPLSTGARAVQDVRGRLSGAAAACAGANDWSAEVREAAQALAAGRITQDAARDALSEKGIEAGGIDRWLGRQSRSVRQSLELSFADSTLLMNDLLRAGAPSAELALQVDKIRAYVAARAMIYRVEQGLSLP